jgi:hypothetical protein
VKNKLDNVTGEVGVAINQKRTNVLQNNVRFSILQDKSNILTGEMEGLPEDVICDDLVYFKYAYITSIDVERSFSRYKNILSDNRRRLDVDNLKNALMVQ